MDNFIDQVSSDRFRDKVSRLSQGRAILEYRSSLYLSLELQGSRMVNPEKFR